MPLSRYSTTKTIVNDDELYDELFRERGVKQIVQYETPRIYFPDLDQMKAVQYETRRWKMGDRLYKISHEFYGDSRYWWVIAQFNQKPTEMHFKNGEIYCIPLSLELILEYYRV